MIDFHAHQPSTGEAFSAGTSSSARDYVDFMSLVGIDTSVIFTLDGLLNPGHPANDELSAYIAEAPAHLLGFGTCVPRDRNAASEVERCFADLGFRGLKFHPWLQGFNPHESWMDPICELAAAHAAPILFHDGTPPYSTSLQIAVLARRNPDTTIILGHGGLQDLWREAITAVCDTPNLVICMCGLPPYVISQVVRACPLERIVFGTDAGLGPLVPNSYVAARIAQLELAGLTDAQLTAIIDKNPRRLLQL